MTTTKKVHIKAHFSYDEKERTEEKLLHIWNEYPAHWLDEFRTPKQVSEASRRRVMEEEP